MILPEEFTAFNFSEGVSRYVMGYQKLIHTKAPNYISGL